jgi:hypothetical protein
MNSRILAAGLMLAAGCLLPAIAAASPTAQVPVLAPLFEASPAAAPDAALLPANTVVELELVDPIGSETSHKGDFFKLRVVVPVQVDGKEVVPMGTLAVGQVVHAAKAGMGGKGGELLLAARYLELPAGHVKLRSTFGAAGQGHVVASLVVAELFGPFGLIVHGKHVDLPAGTRIAARVAPPAAAVAATATEAATAPSPAGVEPATPALSAAPSSP